MTTIIHQPVSSLYKQTLLYGPAHTCTPRVYEFMRAASAEFWKAQIVQSDI